MIPSPSPADNKLNVVLVHRYFHPDTPPYASILKEIAFELAKRQRNVTVLTCQPSYNRAAVSSAPKRELLAPNLEVFRCSILDDRGSTLAKIVNLATFSVRVIARLARMKRPDVVMAASTPPVIVAMVASIMARLKGAQFVYHKQDIYPEVTDGGEQLPRLLRAVFRFLDRATDHRADRVVVLSEDMARTTMERGLSRRKIEVLNNFDPWPLPEGPGRERREGGPVRFIYAGNLGRFQNFESLFAAIRHFATDNRVSFDFVGDGPMRRPLDKLVAEQNVPNVRIHGYVDPVELAQSLRESFDVGIVSLHPGVIGSAYPSKTMSYLRNGLPVLALVESGTELARTLEHSRAGWQADPAVPGALEAAITNIVAAPEELPKRARAAQQMYDQAFGKAKQLNRWSQLIEQVGIGRR